MTTNELRIAVFPGDGIGIEDMDVCLTVLQQLEQHVGGFRLITERLPAGANFYRETGTDITDETMQKARQANAILLGAMGLPDNFRRSGSLNKGGDCPGSRSWEGRL
jgi:3-isopropylmalate dehydrogenase